MSDPVTYYKSYLGINALSDLKKELQKAIKSSHLTFDESKLQNCPEIKVLNTTLNLKIINLVLNIAGFTIEISIINEPFMSRSHLL